MNILATATNTGGSVLYYILMMVVLFGLMYFVMIRPQQKETKRKNAMLSELAVGDTVLTTSGFYGIAIDITEDAVIVEFGNNKNSLNVLEISSNIFAIFLLLLSI